jgi:hypothetical protein
MIEGRYGSTGWIFTLGESVSSVALVTGAMGLVAGCVPANHQVCNRGAAVGLFVGGAFAFLGFRGWDIADAVLGPQAQNARYRAAQRRNPAYAARVMPFVAPVDHGTTAGVSLDF